MLRGWRCDPQYSPNAPQRILLLHSIFPFDSTSSRSHHPNISISFWQPLAPPQQLCLRDIPQPFPFDLADKFSDSIASPIYWQYQWWLTETRGLKCTTTLSTTTFTDTTKFDTRYQRYSNDVPSILYNCFDLLFFNITVSSELLLVKGQIVPQNEGEAFKFLILLSNI